MYTKLYSINQQCIESALPSVFQYTQRINNVEIIAIILIKIVHFKHILHVVVVVGTSVTQRHDYFLNVVSAVVVSCKQEFIQV